MNKYELKNQIINFLWDEFSKEIPLSHDILAPDHILDHLAIIDLYQSKNTGIPHLRKIFELCGFEYRGEGYLPQRANQFIWLTDPDSNNKIPHEALPQIVLADFRIENLSKNTQEIINKYITTVPDFDLIQFEKLVKSDADSALEMFKAMYKKRLWDLPSIDEYQQINQENNLLAWVLLFGRKVNHFGVNVSFDNRFKELKDLHEYVKKNNIFSFNDVNGEIKGGKDVGISQSSTLGPSIRVPVKDGEVLANNCFIEFVWRYQEVENPKLWKDYYNGFIPTNANYVIESLLK